MSCQRLGWLVVLIALSVLSHDQMGVPSRTQMKRVLEECVITTDCSVCQPATEIRLTGTTITALPSGAGMTGYFTNSLVSFTVDEDNNLETIGNNAFSICTKLTSFEMRDSSRLKRIGSYAFYYNSQLTSFVLVNAVALETIGDVAFGACNKLTSIDIGEPSPNFAVDNGIVYSEDKKTLVAYPCGRTNTDGMLSDITAIGRYAFAYCTKIKSLNLEELNSLTSIGDYAFTNMNDLTSLVFYDASDLQSIGANAFYGCNVMTAFIIHDTSALTSFGAVKG